MVCAFVSLRSIAFGRGVFTAIIMPKIDKKYIAVINTVPDIIFTVYNRYQLAGQS